PTGVQLPQRAPTAASPPLPRRPTGTTVPPPVPTIPGLAVAPIAAPQPGTMVSPGLQTARPGSHSELAPAPVIHRDSAPALPPPPPLEDPPTTQRAILNAITPGPAAEKRDRPAPEARDGGRRTDDQRPKPTTLPPALPTRAPSPPPVLAPRSGSHSVPPATPPPRTTLPRPSVDPSPYTVIPTGQFNDDFNTVADANPLVVEPSADRPRMKGDTPPPTRINRDEAHVDRPFTPPKVDAVPEIPEPGLYLAARYAVRFTKAKWQRRGAIKTLGAEIKQDTEALDQVLGALGKAARTARVDTRVFSAENIAINAAEERIKVLGSEHGDVDGRKAEENSKFVDVERERNAKLSEAERMVDEVTKELGSLEGQRRGLRDRRKELERRQKAYLRSAEDNDKQSGSAQMGESRAELRRSAEQHRKEAAALEPDRQDADRRLAGLERPIGEATARLDAAKAELDAAKRSLSDAREGHTHRLAELDAEQKRKSREIAQAESEVTRRLVTLGTLVNLNRIDDPQFGELYQRIDRLRGAITARTTEIEKLTAEREAYDRGSLVRGVAVLGGAVIVLIALIVILRAIL
ncbi:MAG: hypothetical protein H0T46_13380, partial [Deltaproteobacteria bacterium]|nr:hypothetical protein [Deltaproteobacteria bacterium]